jgi:cytochrome c
MNKLIKGSITAALAVFAVGCAQTVSYPTGDITAGAEVFRKCISCHSEDPNRKTFGPQLKGVYGRKAGTFPEFEYSDALKNSGIVWDDNYLREWMAGNTQIVIGTRMRHVKITDLADQDHLLAYIKYISSGIK